MWTMNFQTFKFDLKKAEEPQIPNICWIIKKAWEFQKKIYFYFIDYAKVFDCVDHYFPQTGKFFKRWDYQTMWPASWEIYIQVKKP